MVWHVLDIGCSVSWPMEPVLSKNRSHRDPAGPAGLGAAFPLGRVRIRATEPGWRGRLEEHLRRAGHCCPPLLCVPGPAVAAADLEQVLLWDFLSGG